MLLMRYGIIGVMGTHFPQFIREAEAGTTSFFQLYYCILRTATYISK